MYDDISFTQRRLAELSGSSSGNASGMPNLGGMSSSQPGGGGGGDPAEAAQKRAQEDESRRTVMSQILSSEARERRKVSLVPSFIPQQGSQLTSREPVETNSE